MKPCNHPGCKHLVRGSTRFCDEHKHKLNDSAKLYDKHRRANDPSLSQAAKIRSSARWKAVRLMKLGQQPTCEDPFKDHERRGTMESAKQVHHIQGLAERPDLAFSWSNLMSVCSSCHSKIEAQVRKG